MHPVAATLALVLGIAVLVPAFASPAGAAAEGLPLASLRPLPTPAGAGSVTPHLSRSHDGEVWMSWLEPLGRGHALKVARLLGHRWSTPLSAAEGDSFFVNWADRPGVLAMGEGCLAAWWLWKSGADTYAYDVRLSFSGDRGRTWSAPVCPHRDGTETEHGFVSLLRESDSGVRAIWLDGRNFAKAKEGGEAAGHGDHGAGADMTVRTAVIRLDGSLREESLIDGRACDCCPTDAVATMSGTLVAYRDRSAEEVRDIWLVRGAAVADVPGGPSQDDSTRARQAVVSEVAWGEPYPLHRDGWKIPGCPVNGPALDAEDDRVAVAWYSEAGDSARVFAAFSKDGGRQFGEPVRVDEGKPLGRVDVALLEDRTALVVWLESGEKEARILARRVTPAGSRTPPVTIAPTSLKRGSGYPRLVRDGRRIIFAWTEAGETPRVRVSEAMVRD